jgi:hypothetical protein
VEREGEQARVRHGMMKVVIFLLKNPGSKDISI